MVNARYYGEYYHVANHTSMEKMSGFNPKKDHFDPDAVADKLDPVVPSES